MAKLKGLERYSQGRAVREEQKLVVMGSFCKPCMIMFRTIS